MSMVCILRNRRPPRSTLLPYTTHFRSPPTARGPRPTHRRGRGPPAARPAVRRCPRPPRARCPARRSEEHTSELQSRQYLVCSLLLEKKTANWNSYGRYNELDVTASLLF